MRRNPRQSSSLRQQLLFKNELPEKEDVSLCKNGISSTSQLKSGDHSTLDHPGTDTFTASTEIIGMQ
jgi:hypothetical protein